MCGIFASIGSSLTQNELIDKLKRLEHRGPDNIGYYHEEDDKLFFGHTRLSIIDLNSMADQPMKKESSTLIYNGEIYNYLDLRFKYLSGVDFSTNSDTEVLLYLLEKFGSNILPELDGIFAFVYYNSKSKDILVARDRMGVKPLYYHRHDCEFEFSSEIKTFAHSFSDSALKTFVLSGNFQDGDLPYRDVEVFKPGRYMLYNMKSKNYEYSTYHYLSKTICKSKVDAFIKNSKQEIKNSLDDILNSSISKQLQSDARVGALLSGGIDSSLISAISLKYRDDLTFYHAGVSGGGGEEYYADLVAKKLKIPINYVYVEKASFLNEIPYITYISDLPLYHPNDVSLSLVSKLVRAHGVKVLLCGEGADELFGGYSWHRKLYQGLVFKDLLDKLGIFNAFNKIRSKVPFFPITFDKQDYIDFMTSRGINNGNVSFDLLSRSALFVQNNYRSWDANFGNEQLYEGVFSQNDSALGRLLYNDITGHLSTILHRTDRILMANSIEGRVPFLSNELIDFGMNLPIKYKVSPLQGKYILKELATKYLPKEVIYRKKAGFPVPWQNYINDVDHIFVNGFISNELNISNNSLERFYRNSPLMKWRLLSLEIWGRIFVLKQDYTDIRLI